MNAHVPAPENVRSVTLTNENLSRISDNPIGAPARISQPRVIAAVLIYDLLAVTTAGVHSAAFSNYMGNSSVWGPLAAGLGVAVMVIAALQWRFAYTIPALGKATRQIAESGLFLFVALAGFVFASFMLAHENATMRPWIAQWFVTGWLALALSRVVCSQLVSYWKRDGRLTRRAVVAGG